MGSKHVCSPRVVIGSVKCSSGREVLIAGGGQKLVGGRAIRRGTYVMRRRSAFVGGGGDAPVCL